MSRPSARKSHSPAARPSARQLWTDEQSDPKEKQKEIRRKLREELKAQQFTNDQTQKLIKKYDQMPDKFYEGINEIGPVCFGSRQMMDKHGYTPSVPTDLWEWMAGSATLSATARTRKMTVLPPIDHRWGFHMGTKPTQEKLLYTLLVYGTDLLFGSPTCTPWGGHARSWDEENRAEQRQAQGRSLDFLGAACVIQLCLGRHFVLENPHGSDIWTESALRHLTAKLNKTVLDQCQFDTQMDGKPVKKTTDLFSDCPLPQLSRRCDHSHEHTVLQGKMNTAAEPPRRPSIRTGCALHFWINSTPSSQTQKGGGSASTSTRCRPRGISNDPLFRSLLSSGSLAS